MRAFLKHLPKNILAIFTICDDVSILRFRYMLRSNPDHSGGRDRSNEYAGDTMSNTLVLKSTLQIFVFLDVSDCDNKFSPHRE